MIIVYGMKEKLNPIKAQLSDVIHDCRQSVLGMPEDKRAHRFVPMDKEDFYYPGGMLRQKSLKYGHIPQWITGQHLSQAMNWRT